MLAARPVLGVGRGCPSFSRLPGRLDRACSLAPPACLPATHARTDHTEASVASELRLQLDAMGIEGSDDLPAFEVLSAASKLPAQLGQ